MVENNSNSDNQKVKVCVMRHGETSYIAEYMERINAKKAAGFVRENQTAEEFRLGEIDFNNHAMQAKFIDD